MRAMILAAGLGTRLGALTQNRPKCLMSAGGKTLLQHSVERLQAAGVSQILVNTHYLADQVEEFLLSMKMDGVHFSSSYEPELLGTGGGLFNARGFFQDVQDFFVFNSDVFIEIDLLKILEYHRAHAALATLAVMNRPTSRPLLFDEKLALCGWENLETETGENFGASEAPTRMGFSGVHVVSTKFFEYCEEFQMPFSIISPYMSAAKAGQAVLGYNIGEAYWIDAGVPARLQELQRFLG